MKGELQQALESAQFVDYTKARVFVSRSIMSNDKTEKSETPNSTPASDYGQKPVYTWKKGVLAVADFGLIVASTSVLITVVQSPLKSVAMNLTKVGKFSEHDKPWSYPAIAALYRGSIASLSGGVARSAYVVGSKSVASKEAQLEMAARESSFIEGGQHEIVAREGSLLEGGLRDNIALGIDKSERKLSVTENQKTDVVKKESLLNKVPNVALVTIGDVIVTQVSETKAQLTKAGLHGKLYKWNSMANVATLAKLGVVSRFSGSMVNFTALCVATDFYAQYIPGDNKNIKQTLGGMISGLTAAVISFPFSYYRDYLITKVTHSEGKLITPRASQVIYDAMQSVKKMNQNQLMSNAITVAKNVGVRTLTTSVTFAIVAGVSSVLGSDPVSRLVNDSSTGNTNPTQKHKKLLNEIKSEKKEDKTPEIPEFPTKSSKL